MKFTLTLATVALVLQGCSPMARTVNFESQSELDTDAVDQLTAPSIGTNAAEANDTTKEENVIANFVSLRSIDFGGSAPRIGVYSSETTETSPEAAQLPPQPLPPEREFAYRLRWSDKGVVDLATNLKIYSLTSDEISSLRSVLRNSAIGTRATLLHLNCPATLAFQVPYGRLNTYGGVFRVTDSDCAPNLLKIATFEPAGLREFLERLEDKINFPQPESDLALGLYPLNSLRTLVFSHVGGFYPAPHVEPTLTITATSSGAQLQLTKGLICSTTAPCPVGAVIVCSRPMTLREVRDLKSNLVKARIGIDPSDDWIVDAGDDQLQVVTSDAVAKYNFIGGDSSHQGPVIIGPDLQRQLRELLNLSDSSCFTAIPGPGPIPPPIPSPPSP